MPSEARRTASTSPDGTLTARWLSTALRFRVVTHVNGARISAPTRLAPGDEFALGSDVLRVLLRSSSALTVKVDSMGEAKDKRVIKGTVR